MLKKLIWLEGGEGSRGKMLTRLKMASRFILPWGGTERPPQIQIKELFSTPFYLDNLFTVIIGDNMQKISGNFRKIKQYFKILEFGALKLP